MITLILTEKPSVARDFAKALAVRAKKKGYLEGNGYVITWAVGHLLELADPHDYRPEWKKWNLASLPILPEKLVHKPIGSVKEQLDTVQKQLTRGDLDRVVVATDAGREGEVIARTILDAAQVPSDQVYRFWTSQALTPEVIKEALGNLKPAAEFDRLWEAGRARQAADWLVGINFSRAATLKMGSPRNIFSVGRVQTAVLALLVDRKRERENFVPEPYWVMRALFALPWDDPAKWMGTWFRGKRDRLYDKQEAEQIAAAVHGRTGMVESVKRQRKRQAPPLLYSLTDLQRDANTKFGYSAKQTLDIAQRLYEEKKCLSYPRTDSRVLGSQNVNLVRKIISKLSPVYPELFQGVEAERVSASYSRVFNDAKLTDHHALIALAPLAGNASAGEKRIYHLVLKRFAAAFHQDYEYEATEIITAVGGEKFRTTGSRPLVYGWKAIYAQKKAAQEENGGDPEAGDLPLLRKGDRARVDKTIVDEKMTQPPPEFTEALLLKDMTNPSRYISNEELQKIFKGDVGLGTQATRAQIIETLLERGYVTREKKKLFPTGKGCFLIDRLREFQTAKVVAAPEETARWELELEKIARGVGNADDFLKAIRKLVEAGVSEFKTRAIRRSVDRSPGKCPACGGDVIEGKKGFGCSNWRGQDGACRFVVWKKIAGTRITSDVMRRLLAGKTSPMMKFQSKAGRRFSAFLKLELNEETKTWGLRFVFPEKKSKGAPMA